MKKLLKKVITGAVIAAGLMSGASGGTVHAFTVTCPNNALVVEWAVGDIDPGKEFLRAVTGNNFPGCSVNDYQPGDAALPRIHHGHEQTLLAAAPLIGSIIGSIVGSMSGSSSDRH